MSDQLDHQQLRARVRQLEALCTDVLVAGVDSGLPPHILPQLWGAVGPRPLCEIPDPPPTLDSLAPAKDESRPRPLPEELKPLGMKQTVAVVDDDPMMLDVLSRILQRENFNLLMASSGREMIRRLSDIPGHIDLLITDYAMPGMQGRELAEHVRARFPSVKVLYQTGFSDLLFENRMELEDGAAFLEKPFTARGLREAVRLVLFGSINP